MRWVPLWGTGQVERREEVGPESRSVGPGTPGEHRLNPGFLFSVTWLWEEALRELGACALSVCVHNPAEVLLEKDGSFGGPLRSSAFWNLLSCHFCRGDLGPSQSHGTC